MKITDLLQRWLPENANINPVDNMRSRFFIIMSSILVIMDVAFLLFLSFIVDKNVDVSGSIVYLLFPKQLVHVLSAIAFFKFKKIATANLILVWGYFLWLWIGVLVSGHLYSPFLLVFVFFPVLSSFLVHAQHGLFMFFFTIAILISLLILERSNIHIPVLISVPRTSDVYSFVIVNGLLSTPLIFSAYEMILRAMQSQMDKDRQQFLEYAEYENLTGLLNYRAFENILHSNLLQKVPFAFFYIDLDNFKLINQRYGVVQGDKILQQLAARICNVVDNQQVVSRVGSDEFAVIVYMDKVQIDCADFAQQIKASVEKPVILDEEQIVVGCHVGYHSTIDGAKTKASLYSIAKSRMITATG